MRAPKVSLPLIAAMILCGMSPRAWAGAKEEVATAKWAEAFAADTPDRILALYDQEAALWRTLSPTLRADRQAIREYFVMAFAALPGHKVTLGDQFIRVYGETAINTGYYTFSYTKEDEHKTLPARYSFTYVKRHGHWMILDHHSSAMPAPLH